MVKGHSGQFYIFLIPRKPILDISDNIHWCLHSEVSIGNVTAPV